MLLCVAPLALVGSAWSKIDRDYRFPTRIYGIHEGKEYPVAGVANKRPFVEIDGQREKLKWNTGYRLTRGVRYAKGYVNFRMVERSDVEPMPGREVENPIGRLTDFSGKVRTFETDLVPGADFKDCYALLVLYDGLAHSRGVSDATRRILFKEIGDLKKGEVTRLRIDLEGTDFGMLNLQAFPVIYSENVEVRTEVTDFVSDYVRREYLAYHSQIVEGYLGNHSGASRDLACYRYFPAIPTQSDQLSSYPKSVVADVKIGANGVVASIDLDDAIPEFVRGDAIESMRDWLFVPKLEDGEPVEANGTIEIVFEFP